MGPGDAANRQAAVDAEADQNAGAPGHGPAHSTCGDGGGGGAGQDWRRDSERCFSYHVAIEIVSFRQ